MKYEPIIVVSPCGGQTILNFQDTRILFPKKDFISLILEVSLIFSVVYSGKSTGITLDALTDKYLMPEELEDFSINELDENIWTPSMLPENCALIFAWYKPDVKIAFLKIKLYYL